MADSGRACKAKRVHGIYCKRPFRAPPLALLLVNHVKTYSVVMAFVTLGLESLVRFAPFFAKFCESWEYGLHFLLLN